MCAGKADTRRFKSFWAWDVWPAPTVTAVQRVSSLTVCSFIVCVCVCVCVCSLHVQAFPLVHAVPCLGYVIEEPPRRPKASGFHVAAAAVTGPPLGKARLTPDGPPLLSFQVDAKRARELGVVGPELGRLVKDGEVVTAAGVRVTAGDVCHARPRQRKVRMHEESVSTVSVIPCILCVPLCTASSAAPAPSFTPLPCLACPATDTNTHIHNEHTINTQETHSRHTLDTQWRHNRHTIDTQ